MTTQELKQYIDKVLGNSIRCLLPSYWWKRLFTQVADKIGEVDEKTHNKVGVSDLKTINGESIVGEGDIHIDSNSVIAIYEGETSQRNADAFYKIRELHENGQPATNVVVVDGVAYSAAVTYEEINMNGVGTGVYVVMAQYTPIDSNPQRTIVTPRILMLVINKDTGEGAADIIITGGVDSELSDTSESPIQNKAVYAALQNFANDFQFSIDNLSESDRQISQEVNNKVDKTYVDNAIANAITTTLNTAV